MVDRENRNLQTTNKSCYVLSCRISGESTFTQNGKEFTAKQGDVLYIPYGSSYQQSCKREKVIYIHLEAFSAAPSNIMLLRANDPEYVCSLFLKCYKIFTKKEHAFAKWQRRVFIYFTLPACSRWRKALRRHFAAAEEQHRREQGKHEWNSHSRSLSAACRPHG